MSNRGFTEQGIILTHIQCPLWTSFNAIKTALTLVDLALIFTSKGRLSFLFFYTIEQKLLEEISKLGLYRILLSSFVDLSVRIPIALLNVIHDDTIQDLLSMVLSSRDEDLLAAHCYGKVLAPIQLETVIVVSSGPFLSFGAELV